MTTGQTAFLGGALVLLLAVGGEALYLRHRNHADAAAPASTDNYKSDPDDLVFLKHEHPMNFKDARDLKGRTLWVSAAGQMDFYPYASEKPDGKKVDYAHSQGVLLGVDKLSVKDAVEQVDTAKPPNRVEPGDKQILLVFTHGTDPKEYATPVGSIQGAEYTYLTDEIFFYEDPHQLYNYWPANIWQAIDNHTAIPGMNERQVQLALGQVSQPNGDTTGERSVQYDNQGHPKLVAFTHNKATSVTDVK